MAVARSIKSYAPYRTKRVGFLLYLFIVPPFFSIVLALFSLQIKAFVLNFIAFLLFYLALHFSKKGFESEFAYINMKFAKAPKPYKLTGALFLSAATFYSAFILSGIGLIRSLFLATVSFLGYWLWYGLDPRKDKIPQMEGIGSDVALETIQNARVRLQETKNLLDQIKNPYLRDRVEKILYKADMIIQELDENPEMIRPLRKFLIVYLDSIYEVTKSFVQAQEQVSEEIKEQLYVLIDQAQERFEKELQRVKRSEVDRLDTHMRVFDQQLKDI